MLPIELGLAFFMLGFILIFVGIILSIIGGADVKGGNVEGGGVILIGPVPIAFGTSGKWVVIALILAIALMIISMAFIGWVR